MHGTHDTLSVFQKAAAPVLPFRKVLNTECQQKSCHACQGVAPMPALLAAKLAMQARPKKLNARRPVITPAMTPARDQESQLLHCQVLPNN